jgi:dienelactone hydrolase
MRRRFLFGFALVLAVSATTAAPAFAQSLAPYGVVLMHGKGGHPGGPIGGVAAALKSAGATVVMPEMPWSRARMYDASYSGAMMQIDAAVKRLRAEGKRRIVIGGMSFGANAAIGYATQHGDIAAVLALSPGHTPELAGFQKALADSVAKARQLLAGGKGDIRTTFGDLNQGHRFQVSATPKVYLSYFDPHGPASMTANAAAMKPVPIFMAVGTRDRIVSRARGQFFRPAAKNRKSKYVEVPGGTHMNTPGHVASDVVAWLAGL